MIPHTIHYCWFGGKPIPESALRCIASWRKYFPDWEIKEWNEGNFDINSIPYTCQAARRGKWAFVSDYARFQILYDHGGIYFDTDVEVIAPMVDIITKGPFMGFEKDHSSLGVAAGLGMGAEPGMPFYETVLHHYRTLDFETPEGIQLPGTVVKHVTDCLLDEGLRLEDAMQTIAGITIYPNEVFNPLDDATGRLNITPSTRSIHHYAKTWCDNYGPVRTWIMRRLHRHFGVSFFARLRRIIGR